MNYKTRIRVGVLIFEGDKLLLVRMHREDSDDIYVLPGGGVLDGEDLFKAGVREVKEETNLDVSIEGVLYLKTLYTDTESSLEVILLGGIIDAELKKGFNPEDKGKNVLKDVSFIEVSKLNDLNFHPKQLKGLLVEDFRKGFSGKMKYLGNFQYPE